LQGAWGPERERERERERETERRIPKLPDEFMTRFVEVFREVRRGFPIREIQDSMRRQEGLREDEVEVLTALSNGPVEGQRMGDLSKRLHTHHTNTARTIHALATANYVERTKSEADGRGVVVVLTAKGKAVASRLHERRNVYLREILAEFPGEQKEELIATLERLSKVLSKVAANLQRRG
jgi:DNA-binding MarR family transcriptional regulator